MTAVPRVVLLGGTPVALEAAAGIGVEVVLITTEGRLTAAEEELAATVVHVDLSDHAKVERVVDDVHATRPLTRVLALTEHELVPAARLNERLGLGGNPVSAVETLKDKARMRSLLDQRGMSPVQWRLVRGPHETMDFLTAVGGAIIVKPVDGDGSRSVHRIADADQVRAAWAALGDAVMLAEECLTGREVSVEVHSSAGRHTVVAYTEKTLSEHMVEIGHTVPARLTAAERAQAAALVTKFLDAVGLVEGPSHNEMIFTEAGPRIVESQNRVGGGSLRRLVKLAHDVDLVQLAIGGPLGLVPEPADTPPQLGAAAVRFLNPPPGVIEHIDGHTAFRENPDVMAKLTSEPGDIVMPLRSSYDRTVGFVVASGRDYDEAVERAESAIGAIHITVRPQPAETDAKD